MIIRPMQDDIKERNRLRVRREKLIDKINEQQKIDSSLYTPLYLEELMKGSRQKVKVVLKSAKKTTNKILFDTLANVLLHNKGEYLDVVNKLTNLFNNLFSRSERYIEILKIIKKYINENLKSKEYQYAVLVDALLKSIEELDSELNNYRKNIVLRGIFYGEKFTNETIDLDFAIETGVYTLVLDKPNNKRA